MIIAALSGVTKLLMISRECNCIHTRLLKLKIDLRIRVTQNAAEELEVF